MSRGISGGKQVTKLANTSNRIRVCSFISKRINNLIVEQNIQFEFRQVVRPYYFLWDFTVGTTSKNEGNDHFNP